MVQLKMNANLMPFIFLIGIFGAVVAVPYLPASIQQNFIPLVLIGLIALMAINYVYMTITPQRYKHIHGNIRDRNGTASKDAHIFIGANADSNLNVEQFDLSKTVYPVMVPGKDGAQTELLDKPIETLDKKGYNWLFYMRFVAPVNIGPYKKCKSALILSPKTFEESFKFMPREKAAMWAESEIYSYHPSSDDATFYLEDLAHNEYGEDIPVLALREAGGSWDTWRGGDDQFAAEEYTKGFAALVASNAVLQDQFVHSEQKVGVLKNQVEGLNKKRLDFSHAVKTELKYTVAQTGSLEGANDWWNGETNWGPIAIVLVIAAMIAVALYTNPNFGKSLQAIWGAYWWAIIIGIGVAMVAIYRLRGKTAVKRGA